MNFNVEEIEHRFVDEDITRIWRSLKVRQNSEEIFVDEEDEIL